MSREEAAYYLGLDDADEFDATVGKEMPKPRVRVNGKPYWDRRELDRAFDALPPYTPDK